MKKGLLSILLVLAVLIGIFPVTAFAAEPVYVEFSWKDGFVYEGGIFDMRVHVFGANAEKAAFRWQTDPSFGKGHWSDLKDNSAWRGTKTDHLQLYTNSGVLYGTGWENIPFRCLVTVDGKEYATPNFYMQVMPAWLLVKYLGEAKEGFEQPGGVGMGGYNEILSKTEEGFPTHATAYAGSQLGFAINCTDPSRSFFSDFQRSEVSFIPEIKVYKNGSLVQSGEDVCLYTPTAAGDTLTVEHTLYLKAGETDHGVYQSNKMTIDIIAPEPVSSATVKYDCSLLKERYNESQKLISIPKGREVQIVENSGDSWYKVLYYNTVGWLPADALNIQKRIAASNTFDTVEVSMMQPSAELPAPFTAKTGNSGYTVHSIDWFDDAEERFLEQGEVLKGDRTYAVTIWLTAEPGSEFAVNDNDVPAVKGLINGSSVDVNKAYEQDPRQVIELSASFAPMAHTCAPVLVQQVAPTCQQAGHEEYYLCECGKAYRDAAASQLLDPQTDGILPIAAHKAGGWSYNGTHHYRKCEICTAVVPGTNAAHSGDPCKVCGFVSHVCRTELIKMVDPTCERDGFEKYYKCQQCGKTYKDANATQLVDISSWGTIPKLPHTHGDWTFNTTHHASLCAYCNKTIPGTTKPHTGAVCDVCGYVDPSAIKKITSVEIDGVAAPKTGNAPDYTFSVGEGYEIDQNAQDYEYMHRGIAWYDITDGKFVSLRHTFAAGHQYQVYVSLKPRSGYEFGRLWASVNGDDADFAGSNSKLTVSYIFPPCEIRSSTGIRPYRG